MNSNDIGHNYILLPSAGTQLDKKGSDQSRLPITEVHRYG